MNKHLPSRILLSCVALVALSWCICNLSISSTSSRSILQREEDKSDIVKIKNSNIIPLDNTMTPSRLLQSIGNSPVSSLALQWMQRGGDIKSNETITNDNFGESVATSKDGSFVVVGAPASFSRNPGHTRVYHFEDGTWAQVGEDIVGDQNGDDSGASVDINNSGDTIIIGAPGRDEGELQSVGLARVYNYINGQWQQQGRDLVGPQIEYEYFGSSVAISGNAQTVIVGSPTRGSSGSVRVYRYDGEDWVQHGDVILGREEGIEFGDSVDIDRDGSTVIIGSGWRSGGHVNVFKFLDGQWMQLGMALDSEEEDNTAVAISGDGDKVIVGGAFRYANSSYWETFGQAKVYKYEDEQWLQIGDDIEGQGEYDETSGASSFVDISEDGETVIFGTPYHDDTDLGHARVYKLQNGQWKQLGGDLEGEEDDFFGWSVAISGDGTKVVVAAAWGEYVRAYEYVNFCTESPLKVLMGKQRKSAVTCAFVSQKPDKRCKLKKIQTHCPETCGFCDQYESSDSIGKFIFRNKVRNCQWLRDFVTPSTLFQVAALCKREDISATCRRTCGHFYSFCDAS